MTKFNDPLSEWNIAKKEIKHILSNLAQEHEFKLITYSELTLEVTSINFDPDDLAFHHILGEVSEEEDIAGRGMLTAIVVLKDTKIPGSGFFKLAKKLGRDITDHYDCWYQEINKVRRSWGVPD